MLSYTVIPQNKTLQPTANPLRGLSAAEFVFCPLVYLIHEVRNNSRDTLSQNINAEADQIQRIADLQGRPAMMSSIKKIYVDGAVEPDFEDATMLEAYFLSCLSIAQAQFQHKAAGLKSN